MIVLVDPEYRPRRYQLPVFKAIENGVKRILLVWHRRAGKDKTCWEILLSSAFETAGNYWYAFPEYSQGRKAFWQSIDSQGKRIIDYIPAQLLYKNSSDQEMIIYLKTRDNIEGKDPKSHSTIQVVGADKPDSLRGSNPKGVIASEFSEWKKPSVYETIIEPVLVENGGWFLANGCVTKDTLVYTKNGVRPILSTKPLNKELTLSYNPYTVNTDDNCLHGLKGFNMATDFYVAGKQPTLKVVTSTGFELTGTVKHKLMTRNREWKRFDELVVGDEVCVSRGMFIDSQNNQDAFNEAFYKEVKAFEIEKPSRPTRKHFRPDLDPTLDFFYLAGLFLAEGSYDKNSINITNPDDEIKRFLLEKFGFALGGDGLHHKKNWALLNHMLQWFGLLPVKGKEKRIPARFYEISTENQKAFIQGYFDGDGTCHVSKRGDIKVSCCSASIALIKELQVILLNYGVVAYYSKAEIPPNKKVMVHSTSHALHISGYSATLFKQHIGFRLSRKNAPLEKAKLQPFYGDISNAPRKEGGFYTYRTLNNKKAKLTPEQKEELEDCFFYAPIKAIEDTGVQETYDYVVPITNSFTANGMISHNTPKGRNALYYLYEAAKQNKHWFTSLLTIEDTSKVVDGKVVPVISQEDIQNIRDRKQTPEEIILQEYYCDFNAPVSGTYYAQQLDQLHERGNVKQLPYNPRLKTYTGWDFGFNDATSVWWLQVDTETGIVHAIDYQEWISTPLPTICHEVNRKPYNVHKHIAPHDVLQCNESGLTKFDIAKQNGVTFHYLSDTVSKKARKPPLLDGIEQVRLLLPRMVFCSENASEGLECLRNYKRKYDADTGVYQKMPVHDKYSHGADALRSFAVWWAENEKHEKLSLKPSTVNVIVDYSYLD